MSLPRWVAALLCLLQPLLAHAMEEAPTALIEGNFYRLSYLAERWESIDVPAAPGVTHELRHRDGTAHAHLRVGEPGMDLDELKLQAMTSARTTLTEFHLLHEADRRLGQNKVAVLHFSGRIHGITYQFYNYYWAGLEGTLELSTRAPSREFPALRRDMKALLDGLLIMPAQNP